jgi:DNA-binding NarL/FixJ family response regulator
VDVARPNSLLIIEDRRLLAQSLCQAFAAVDIACIVITEPSVEAIAATLETVTPIAAVVAVGFGSDGLTEEAVGLLSVNGIPTIVMTGGDDQTRLARCVAEGAVGIADRSASFETLVAMVKETSGLDSLLSPLERMRLQDHLRRHRLALQQARRPFERLTGRELEVLRDLSEGHHAAEIAERSFVSISTVRSQIRSILTKLGVSSQLAAVACAHRAHVFDEGIPGADPSMRRTVGVGSD